MSVNLLVCRVIHVRACALMYHRLGYSENNVKYGRGRFQHCDIAHGRLLEGSTLVGVLKRSPSEIEGGAWMRASDVELLSCPEINIQLKSERNGVESR